MTTTDQINALQGHVKQHTPVSGVPTRVWVADVITVNPDGTVNCQPVASRASKVNVPVPDAYVPQLGDRVIVTDINGDRQSPVVIATLVRAGVPSVTGSRSSGAALQNLLAVLAAANLIVDNTTP